MGFGVGWLAELGTACQCSLPLHGQLIRPGWNIQCSRCALSAHTALLANLQNVKHWIDVIWGQMPCGLGRERNSTSHDPLFLARLSARLSACPPAMHLLKDSQLAGAAEPWSSGKSWGASCLASAWVGCRAGDSGKLKSADMDSTWRAVGHMGCPGLDVSACGSCTSRKPFVSRKMSPCDSS